MAGRTLRNLYCKNPINMRRVWKAKTMKHMIEILPFFNNDDYLLEHLMNLHDYIVDAHGTIFPAYAKDLINHGLNEQLATV